MPWVFLYDLYLIAWRLGLSLNLELYQSSAGPYDLSIPPCPTSGVAGVHVDTRVFTWLPEI